MVCQTKTSIIGWSFKMVATDGQMKLADAKCSFEIKSPSQPFDVPKDWTTRYDFFSFA